MKKQADVAKKKEKGLHLDIQFLWEQEYQLHREVVIHLECVSEALYCAFGLA